MSIILQDNSFLTWLQDPANDNYRDDAALTEVYTLFMGHEAEDDPLSEFNEDDQSHSFLAFQKSASTPTTSEAIILHHAAKYPSRIGTTTAYDNRWYLTGGDIQGGSHVTYDVPTSLLIPLVDDPGYAYYPNRINTEIANQPDLAQIVAVADDDNLEDVELLTPRRGM